MKLNLLTAIAVLAGLATVSGTPEKELKKKGRGKPVGRPNIAQLIEKFDTDGDGKLSDAEKEAAREARKAEFEARRAEILEKFDTDGDGKLSPEERKAAIAAARARREGQHGKPEGRPQRPHRPHGKPEDKPERPEGEGRPERPERPEGEGRPHRPRGHKPKKK